MTTTVSTHTRGETPMPATDEPGRVPLPLLSGHIPALDGLRGVAILMVMWFHYYRPVDIENRIGVWLVKIPQAGWCGVDLFFVLSGFLITGILLDAKGTPRYFRNFYMRRVLRIFPLYYGVLIAVFVVLPRIFPAMYDGADEAFKGQGWLWLYGTNFHIVQRQAFYLSGRWFELVHFWSLAVEEHFYLVWPALVWLLSRRAMAITCAACVAIALAVRLVLAALGYHQTMLFYPTFCRMDGLALGGLLAILVRNPIIFSKLPRLALVVLIITGAILAGELYYRKGMWPNSPLMHSAGYTILSFFFGAILLLAIHARPEGLAGRLFSLGVLRFFGKYSYGLYVFHLLLNPLYKNWLPFETLSRHIGSHGWSVFLWGWYAIGVSLIIAYASWHLYEKPFMHLKRFFSYETTAVPSRPDHPPFRYSAQ